MRARRPARGRTCAPGRKYNGRRRPQCAKDSATARSRRSDAGRSGVSSVEGKQPAASTHGPVHGAASAVLEPVALAPARPPDSRAQNSIVELGQRHACRHTHASPDPLTAHEPHAQHKCLWLRGALAGPVVWAAPGRHHRASHPSQLNNVQPEKIFDFFTSAAESEQSSTTAASNRLCSEQCRRRQSLGVFVGESALRHFFSARARPSRWTRRVQAEEARLTRPK